LGEIEPFEHGELPKIVTGIYNIEIPPIWCYL
jgi:hypothetical protein